MNSIDPEIKKRIEYNRQQALIRQAEAKARQQATASSSENRSSGNRYAPYPPRPQPNNVLNTVRNNPVVTPQVPQSNQKVQSWVPKAQIPQSNQKAQSSMANGNHRYDPIGNRNPQANKMNGTSNPQQIPRPGTSSASTSANGNNINPQPNKWQAKYNPVQHENRMNGGPSKKELTITVEVISDNRFQIRFVYDDAVITELKKLPSKSWNPTSKLWSFTLNDYKPFISTIDTKFKDTHNIKVENRIPDFALKLLLRPTPPINNECLEQIDAKLLKTLLPFQKEGVAFGISRNGRVMICDDMGLGKTRQALGIASFYRHNGSTLIVTIASTREFWRDEILKVLDVRERDVKIMPGYIDEAEYVVVSYHGLDQYQEELQRKKFTIIIFDESHHLKNPKANQTKMAQKLAKSAKNIIMLSGTPALSRPSELYTQLEMIQPNFMTFHQYGTRFCNGRQTNFGFDATGCSNMTELEIILKKQFMIRRIKSDVFDQLENKHREGIFLRNLKLTEDQQNENDELRSQFDDAFKEKMDHEVLVQWFTSTAHVKAPGVCKFVEKLLTTTSEKILLFGHHTVMLNAITAMLETRHIPHIRIDGSTAGEKRSERVQNFQHNENIRVAVLSTLATNAGITLTAASVVVFCELEYNPSNIIQAEARAHRIGQQNQVKVYFLLAPGTADDRIWQLITKKQTNLGKAGLVDNIEYLSNSMKFSDFDCQKDINDVDEDKSQEKETEDNAESQEKEEDSSSDTFYSCNTKTSQEESKPSMDLTAEEQEELRRVEAMLDDDF